MSKKCSNREKLHHSECDDNVDCKSDSPSERERDESDQETKLEACSNGLEQWKSQFLRSNADFENFKRRMEKEQAQWYQTAQAQLLLELLNVVDDFDRAFEGAQKQKVSEELAGWFKGFELIYKSLHRILQKYEVQEIEQMTEFDPNLHEALAQIDSPEHESGQIVDVMQKGYTFKGQVLRPAKVSVAR